MKIHNIVEILNTYHVSGTLEKESPLPDTSPDRKSIYREVEASDQQAAIDQFSVNGWEWSDTPSTWLVTEAMKLERSGEVPLFVLPPKG